MTATRYFEEPVLPKRPYIRPDWCESALSQPIRKEIQADGRIRFWWKVEALSEERPRYLRVVTLADGETAHNAFLDRDFREDP